MKIKLFTIPNLLTLANLLCGSAAAVSALVYGDLVWAFWLVVAAAVFDFFDGFAARLLHSTSPIGVQLDSLADMVSFGFVPAAVLFELYGQVPDGFASVLGPQVLDAGCYAVFIITAFSALRLAKFNIDDSQHAEFEGLPTPACTLFCVSLGLLGATGEWVLDKSLIVLTALLMSWLLVSPVRMFALKFKGFGYRGNELRYGFIVACIVLLILLHARAVPVIILLYIVVSAIRWLAMRNKRVQTDR